MTDKSIRQDIIDQLDFDPSISAEHIGVTVQNGIVTLSGHVSTFVEKMTVERAVRAVRGVKAIAQEIDVRYPNDKKTADDQIAERALKVLSWYARVPEGVKVRVEHGRVQLSGQVDWQYQRTAAERAVRELSGVVSVSNLIELHQKVAAPDVQKKIEGALQRHAEIEAEGIKVSVAGGKVTLDGRVNTLQERMIVESAAWSAPGVHSVVDHLKVA
ncbi:MAG: BON domain-containing protein [Hyphomicrobiaceae bacterium]|nr:BON domain-containing protein [Hyphomicrobiaceae bacterium]